ncbi:hypothetical protein A2U01_0080966, partial [Trifolium medium]|nr:hypothetical protein [Trifolium medium]
MGAAFGPPQHLASFSGDTATWVTSCSGASRGFSVFRR